MLLFTHLISHSPAHQMFFLVWFPLLGDAEMRTFSPCPEELSPEGEQDNRLFYPQTPANKPPSPALALIPRAIFVADVFEVGGGRVIADLKMIHLIDRISAARCRWLDVRGFGFWPAWQGLYFPFFWPLGDCLLYTCGRGPTAPKFTASVPPKPGAEPSQSFPPQVHNICGI